jgi:uncharacterized protein YyaL (SSP411 family)
MVANSDIESRTWRDPAPDLRTALAWRGWEEGLREAASRGAPILCCAEPAWTTAAQRLARELATTPSLADAVERYAVPIWVDGIACPDLAARLTLSSVAAGQGDLPLLIFLTEQGEFLLGPGAMALDTSVSSAVEQPSLLGILNSLGPRYRASRAEWLAEASASKQRVWQKASPDAAAIAWEDLDAAGPIAAGSIPITPLQLSLDRFERDRDPTVRAAVTQTLDALIRGGVCDQIDAGFHRGAREARWIRPYFEKIIPQNAALAALFARAGKLTGDARYSMVALRTAAFVCAPLGDGDFTGAIAADSDFYTWTPTAFRQALDPKDAARLGRLYGMTGHESRHVLAQARGAAELDVTPSRIGAEEQVERGRRALAAYRARKPPPEPVRITAVDWIAATVDSLAQARSAGVQQIDRAQLDQVMHRLLAGAYDPDRGYAHGPDRHAFLFEDQARCLTALASLAELPGSAVSWPQAAELGAILCARYQDHASGLFLARCDGLEPSHAIVDGMLPSAVGDALAGLGKLARRTGDPGFAHALEAAKAAYRPVASRLMRGAAHYWRSASKNV